jgi:hypothetical protein
VVPADDEVTPQSAIGGNAYHSPAALNLPAFLRHIIHEIQWLYRSVTSTPTLIAAFLSQARLYSFQF